MSSAEAGHAASFASGIWLDDKVFLGRVTPPTIGSGVSEAAVKATNFSCNGCELVCKIFEHLNRSCTFHNVNLVHKSNYWFFYLKNEISLWTFSNFFFFWFFIFFRIVLFFLFKMLFGFNVNMIVKIRNTSFIYHKWLIFFLWLSLSKFSLYMLFISFLKNYKS